MAAFMKACLLTVSLAYYDTKSRGYENVLRLFTVMHFERMTAANLLILKIWTFLANSTLLDTKNH